MKNFAKNKYNLATKMTALIRLYKMIYSVGNNLFKESTVLIGSIKINKWHK